MRTRLMVVGSLALAMIAMPAAALAKPKVPQILFLDMTFTASGQMSVHASNNCDNDSCSQGQFLNGTDSAGFNWSDEYDQIPAVISGSVPGIPGTDGFGAISEDLRGSWNASGQVVGPPNGPPTPFSCAGAVAEQPGSGIDLFEKPLGNGSFQFSIAGAGAPNQTNFGCNGDFPGDGSFMNHYFYGDSTKATGPFSGTFTITKADLGLPTITKTVTPPHGQLPPSDCFWEGSKWIGADNCSISFNWSGTVHIIPKCEMVSTGPGYNQLNATMKADLTKLYSRLKSEKACWHFTIGYRSTSLQKDLYDRWHEIADGSAGDASVCANLHTAGFKQCPKGYTSDGTAKGGPAKPGTSRHEKTEAADITVVFKPELEEDLDKYQEAAKAAGLCGPPASDAVHVELPYKKGKQKTSQCNFKD